MSSIVGYLTLAPIKRWSFDWRPVIAVVDCGMVLDVGWAASEAETPNASQTHVRATHRVDAGESRFIVTSAGRVAECGAGSPLLHVVFFSPVGRRRLVEFSYRPYVKE
jgi:hypothetical protein